MLSVLIYALVVIRETGCYIRYTFMEILKHREEEELKLSFHTRVSPTKELGNGKQTLVESCRSSHSYNYLTLIRHYASESKQLSLFKKILSQPFLRFLLSSQFWTLRWKFTRRNQR